MGTFLNFLERRQKLVTESFNNKDIDNAFEKIDAVLKKHIEGLIPLIGYVKTKQSDSEYYSKQYMVIPKKNPENASLFQINFKQSDNESNVFSIDFFKDMDILWTGKAKSNLTIYTMESSIVYFLPIIWTVVNTGDYNLSEREALDLGKKIFKNENVKESKLYRGTLTYRIFENISSKIIDDTFKLNLSNSILNNQQTIEEMEDDVRDYKKRKIQDLEQKRAHKNDSPEAKNIWKKAVEDIKDIDRAIRGGANTLQELKLALKHNISVVMEIDKELEEAQKKFEEERDDPDMVFKKMNKYVKMVIKGINPSVILCGAPGVGKTFTVKKQLKAAGFNEGHNLCTIKGKCTPRILYLTLHEYKDKGNIVLIDDADGLVGPGAPEDCINILKAALDSTSDDEGRLVSYGVSGPLKDDEGNPIAKRFYYNGGIIVITNYQAGSIDTALRGRSFVQDIKFTTEELLDIIKKLMPAIDPEHLSPKSKIKAYDYLVELSNADADMEVSIRTFGICAKIFETANGDPDFTDDDAKSMIKEQMKLQSQRLKRKKY